MRLPWFGNEALSYKAAEEHTLFVWLSLNLKRSMRKESTSLGHWLCMFLILAMHRGRACRDKEPRSVERGKGKGGGGGVDRKISLPRLS